MRTCYSILLHIAWFHLKLVALFKPKMKLFVEGRKDTFKILKQKISKEDKTIWFHCASLGEFEQGLPIMEEVKKWKPNHKLIVSFFSPSGYEIKKNASIADCVVYLPMDTEANAIKFIQIAHPSLAVFVKYEFWPNFLMELKKAEIPTILISGLFREKQSFFKWYGGFMRKGLRTFEHFFVQDSVSEELLLSIGFQNVTVSGDTRFDRVSHQIERDNSLPFVEEFKGNSLCIVCGSTWLEDEEVLLESINNFSENIKFIIAPHRIDSSKMGIFRKRILKKSVLFSEKEGKDLSTFEVLIIDTIGLLSKIYSYADIAYVGGAMGTTGLHNILEPATFGLPIVIGKNFENFPEANRLQQLAGLYSINNADDCKVIFQKLISDSSFRNKTGMISEHFINNNTGATQKTVQYIKQLKTLVNN